MSIIYSLIARNNVILVDYTEKRGNFQSITQQILDRLPSNRRSSYEFDRYLFNIVQQDGLIFLALCERGMSQYHAFRFLDALIQDFSPYVDTAQSANAYALRSQFENTIAHHMTMTKKSIQNDPLAQAQAEAQSVKEVMVENINKVIERDEKLDLLVAEADDLEFAAEQFHGNARALSRKMWWQNTRMTVMLVLVILAILTVIIVASVCSQKGKC